MAAGRTFLVGVPADMGAEARIRLGAAGIRWKGSYDVLRERWEREMDTTPWTVRHVVQVTADDADSAVQQVAEALGEPGLRTRMEAAEAR